MPQSEGPESRGSICPCPGQRPGPEGPSGPGRTRVAEPLAGGVRARLRVRVGAVNQGPLPGSRGSGPRRSQAKRFSCAPPLGSRETLADLGRSLLLLFADRLAAPGAGIPGGELSGGHSHMQRPCKALGLSGIPRAGLDLQKEMCACCRAGVDPHRAKGSTQARGKCG